jgi:hypothetical protein
MFRKESNLEKAAVRVETRALAHQQSMARAEVDKDFEAAKQRAYSQSILDATARKMLRRSFNTPPSLVGSTAASSLLEGFTSPIFKVEIANLMFIPAEDIAQRIKNPVPRRELGLGRKALNAAFHRGHSEDESLGLESVWSHFEAVEVCSGCQQWGAVGLLDETPHYSSRYLHIETSKILNFDDMYRYSNLIADAASGVATNCGNSSLSSFAISGAHKKSVVLCPNLEAEIESENHVRFPDWEKIKKVLPGGAEGNLTTRTLRILQRRQSGL